MDSMDYAIKEMKDKDARIKELEQLLHQAKSESAASQTAYVEENKELREACMVTLKYISHDRTTPTGVITIDDVWEASRQVLAKYKKEGE